jgi:hypothetical protein
MDCGFASFRDPSPPALRVRASGQASEEPDTQAAWWQGHAIERIGYPATLGLDAAVGLACLLVLPFVAPLAVVPAPAGFAPPSGPGPGAAIPEGVVH